MGGEFIGHRGPDEDEWTWQREELKAGRPRPRRRGPAGPAVVAVGLVGLAAALSLALFLVLRPDGNTPVAMPTATPTPTPTPVLGTTPTAAPPVATATPALSSASSRLALWAARRGEWQFSDIGAVASGYRDGGVIPFLLRIDDANPGTVYQVRLRYDCQTDGVAAFDFLAGYDRDAGGDPALADQGPGRLQPDAAIPVPDDPSIAFDDQELAGERLFRLWGATFDAEPVGPAPDTSCRDEKLMVLRIRAQAETVFLMWGAHLGSAEDWGAGRGAGSQEMPFGIEVRTPGMEPESQELRIVPGAISV